MYSFNWYHMGLKSANGTYCRQCGQVHQHVYRLKWGKFVLLFNTVIIIIITTTQRVVGNTSRKLWQQLVPNIVITKPRSDICWECHQNNTAIYRSANLPNPVKGAKLRKQEEDLRIVASERQVYQQMVAELKVQVADSRLGCNKPCSRPVAVHYSFDYAQQVHYSSDPLQPGSMFFSVLGNVEYLACWKQVSKLIFYLMNIMQLVRGRKVWSATWIISLENYGLGETVVHLHCDNCSGQKKNKFMLWYLLWRVCTGRHEEIENTVFSDNWSHLSFLLIGVSAS